MTTKDNSGRILNVREAVEYIDEQIGIRGDRRHFISESSVRRYLNLGWWTMTRTPAGKLGITVRDLRKPFETVKSA